MELKEKIIGKFPEQKRGTIKKGLHAAKIVKNIICWALIGVLSVTVCVFLITRINGGTPSVFGYTIHRVETGSMEPALMVGDVIINQAVDDAASLEIGDIITFEGGAAFDYRHITHRVVKKPYLDGGEVRLQTKGDANETADAPILADAVESKFVGKLHLLAKLYELFLSPWGLLLFIVLLLFVFFDEILNIVRILSGNYDDENEESIAEIIDRIQREDREKEAAEEKAGTENHNEVQ